MKQAKGKEPASASASEDGEGASLRFRVEGFASLRKMGKKAVAAKLAEGQAEQA